MEVLNMRKTEVIVLTKVMKRDGSLAMYDATKIINAISKANANVSIENRVPEHDIDEIEMTIRRVVLKNPDKAVDIENIQSRIESLLRSMGYQEVYEEYSSYRNKRTEIRNSKLPVMKAIREVSKDAKESDSKRENANVDGNTAMGTMLQYGSTVAKEYALDTLMSKEFAKLHKKGFIHIHDMDFLPMKTLTCCQISLRKLFKDGFDTGHGFIREPKSIRAYSALAAIVIQANQNDQHGGQSLYAFDYDMAKGVRYSLNKVVTEVLTSFLEDHLDKDLSEDQNLRNIVNVNNPVDIEDLKVAMSNKLIEYLGNQWGSGKTLDRLYNRVLDRVNKKTYQSMEAFVHNLNTMHSRAGAQIPFSSVNFGTDISWEGRLVSKNLLLAQKAGLGNGETPIFPILIFKVKEGVNYNEGDPNYDLFQLAIKTSSERLFPNFAFIDAPHNIPYYNGTPESEVSYMGCRTRVIGNIHGDETVDGRGNISFTSINLPRFGIINGTVRSYINRKPDWVAFYRDLGIVMEKVKDQLVERFDIQASNRVLNSPFLMGQGIWRGSDNLGREDKVEEVIKQGSLSIGFIGLAETLVAMMGVHHGESEEARSKGYEIIQFMRDKCDEFTKTTGLNFALLATPAEGLAGRFVKIDRKEFGKIVGITDRDYYTNSYHVPVYHKVSAFDKISIEAPFHKMTNAGHISYIELDGSARHNLKAFETIIRHMKESGIGYGSINHPLDRDPVCGYSGIINDICPNCKRTEEDGKGPFERIRRVTGYLAGTVDRFNNAKQAEVKDRVKHN